MTQKTDDEIQAERDAVAKMRGAQAAMEKALRRIDRLEAALEKFAWCAEDVSKKAGDLMIATHYGRKEGGEIIRVSELLRQMANDARSA